MKKMAYFFIFWLIFSSQAHSSLISALQDYSKGVKLVNVGKYDEAIKILNGVVQENPKLSYANVLIGICYYNEGYYLSGANEIEKFIGDLSNASDGSDKYPLALVYYLRCQNKLKNFDAIEKYYKFTEEYPIPNITGIVFTASTLSDTANIKDCPPDLRKNVSELSLRILDKNKQYGEKEPWFNNAYGLNLMVAQSFLINLDDQIEDLLKAKKCFELEIGLNKRSVVFVSLSITDRLIAEDSIARARKNYLKFKKENTFEDHCAELNEMIKSAFQYYDYSLADIKNAESAIGAVGQNKKIIWLKKSILDEKDGLRDNDSMIKRIVGCLKSGKE